MECSWTENGKECGKKITHFVILEKRDEEYIVAYSCMFHYCKFYGIDIRQEAKTYKEMKNDQRIF